MGDAEELSPQDIVESLLGEAGVVLGAPGVKKLVKELSGTVEDMGGSTKKWMLRSASEELKDVFFPAMSGVGWEGDDDACQALCMRAVTKGGFKKFEAKAPEPAQDEGPFAPPEGLEAIWAVVAALEASDFAAISGEIGELIVERGLGALRYFPPGSRGPDEPEPEPEFSSSLSAQLMKDAAIQARKAKQARAAELVKAKEADQGPSMGTSPLSGVQKLLGVKLEDDMFEYVEGTASGLRDDVTDGNTEKDDAIEELFAVLGPMLEEAGADEEALEEHEAALKEACGVMVSPAEEKKSTKAAPKRVSLREQMEKNKLEEWRVTGAGDTKFAMDTKGMSAQEALRAKERDAQKKDLTPAQIAAKKKKEAKEQAAREKFEQDKMLALLAKQDEKCSFAFEKVEAGDGPGAMSVTGLQFKYDTGGDLLRNSNLLIHANHRYGLIGRNGEGKSSLLRILPEFAPLGSRIHV